jgi:hypothetical protein
LAVFNIVFRKKRHDTSIDLILIYVLIKPKEKFKFKAKY